MGQGLSKNYIHEFVDCLADIESASRWTNERFPCFSCLQRNEASCKTSMGRICISCSMAALKISALKENLEDLTLSHIKEALSEQGSFRSKFAILLRYKEVEEILATKYPKNISEIRTLLIYNMGQSKSHPLDQYVRQAAFDACVAQGKAILPTLLSIDKLEPWELYANVVTSAAIIDPEDKNVISFLEKAAKDPNTEIRKRVAHAIAKKHIPGAQKILSILSNDSDPSISLVAGMASTSLKNQKSSLPSSQKKTLPQQSRLEQLEGLIGNLYSIETLRKLYNEYLFHFYNKEDFKVRGTFSIAKLSKPGLVHALALIFDNSEKFMKLYSLLPNEVKQIFDILVWEGGDHDVREFEDRFNIEIILKSEKPSFGKQENIDSKYLLFNFRTKSFLVNFRGYYVQYSIYLHEDLRKIFKTFLPPPIHYEFNPVEPPIQTKYIFQDDEKILRDIKLLSNYIRQGNLKFSKNSDAVLKSSIIQMTSYCNIKEFYTNGNDKESHYIRTRFIIDFLRETNLSNQLDHPLDYLKEAFDTFFKKSKLEILELKNLLYHLKGMYYDFGYSHREEKVKNTFAHILKNLPVQKWISVNNLIDYCLYRDLFIDIIDKHSAGQTMYFYKAMEKQFFSGYTKVNISPESYKEAVAVPFIKAMIFLFASFGVLDIAYDPPENPVLRDRENPYLSIFDGVKYLRLTRLGAYLGGQTQSFDYQIEDQTANVILDDNRLILTLEGNDPYKNLIIEKIADRIHANSFIVSFNSFLKECKSQADIEQKIELFRKEISDNPPEIWKEFLNDIKNKMDPLTQVDTMLVFKLKPTKELIALVAKDDVLKKHILKAEDYHILIESKNLSKVKKRLEEFGYFMDKI